MSATPETKFCGPRIGPRFGAVAPASTSVGIGAPPESGNWLAVRLYYGEHVSPRPNQALEGRISSPSRPPLDHRHPLLDLGADELAQRRRRLAGLIGKLRAERRKRRAGERRERGGKRGGKPPHTLSPPTHRRVRPLLRWTAAGLATGKRHSASSRMTLIRSDLPSKPMPGSSGMTIWLSSTFTPSGKPP